MNPFNTVNHQLTVEGVVVDEIAQAVGTPCYIYSKQALEENWQAFDRAFKGHPHQICYAVKANSNLAVLNTLAQLNSGFDIVSGGELARVIAAGGDPKKVVFSGVGKQAQEITAALNAGIGCFNVECPDELDLIEQIAQHLNVKANIALRINPNVDPKSHPYIATGLKESKFGIPADAAIPLYEKAQTFKHISIAGIACHIGSQLAQLSPIEDAFIRLLTLIDELKARGITLQHVDIGGGLGVPYQNESMPDANAYGNMLLQHCQNRDLTIFIEPGRAISANTGILVTRVLYLKHAQDKHFCVCDAAMNDLIRPALYEAWHDIVNVKSSSKDTLTYDVVGPVCESGDFLGKNRSLSVEVGDLLAIMNAGAYAFTMSSNYNTRPRACEVMVKDKTFHVVRERETIEELFAKESLVL